MRKTVHGREENGGFTLVELVVVMAVMVLLAALSAGAVFSYQTLSVYKRNNEYARTVFQSAQASLSHIRASGLAEDLKKRVENLYTGEYSGIWDGSTPEEESRCERVYCLNYTGKRFIRSGRISLSDDGSNEETSELLYEILEPYIADEAVFQGSFCVELDPENSIVRGVFYSDRRKLTYGESSGEILGLGATGSRRNDTEYRKRYALGYYGALESEVTGQ